MDDVTPPISSAAPDSTTLSASENTEIKITNKTKSSSSKKKTEDIETTKKKKQKTDRSSSPAESGNAEQRQLGPSSPTPSNRKKSPGIRLVHNRIYDSEKGKCCHQCRQKTLDFAVSCENQIESKQCTLHFCHTCLRNRYGEEAEEMAASGGWKCPRCRGICNCSFCMKKRGCCPTGRLVHAAKATGFSSVSEMLLLKNSEEAGEDADASPEKEIASKATWFSSVSEVLLLKNSEEVGEDPGASSEKEIASKATGFSSMSEVLLLKNSEEVWEDAGASSEKEIASKATGFSSVSAILLLKNSEEVWEIAGAPSEKEISSKATGFSFVSEVLLLNNSEEVWENAGAPSEKEISSKATGFSSVSEVLLLNNSEEVWEDVSATSEKKIASKEEDESGKGNGFEGKSYSKSKHKTRAGHEENENLQTKRLRKNYGNLKETKARTKDGVASPKKLTSTKELAVRSTRGLNRGNYSEGECHSKLPQRIELQNISDIDLPAEDIGHALQFLEFCEAFAKVLDLEKGQSEYLLRELARGRSSHWSQDSSIVQFHIKLLSLIQKDSGKKSCSFNTESRSSWLQALYRCISESLCRSRELLLDCLDLAAEGYGELSSSKKLRLLNFLCDEALGTTELRSWIDGQNLEFLAERHKGRNMKMRLQDEIARDILMKNDVPHTVSEHQNLVLKIKAEAAQNYVETREAKDTVMKKKQRSDAVRTEPMFLDGNGRKFWKLRGYPGARDILIQDIGYGDPVTLKERWFSCNVDERETVENYILRQLRK